MYPSKGNTPYGQQVYGSSQAYGLAGSGYSGNPVGSSDADLSSYRAYSSQTAQYGGPYAAVYSSSAVSNVQQVGGVGSKEAVSTSNLQGRSTYQSALAESSKFPSGTLVSGLGITTDDYGSAATHGYPQKGDQFSSVKNPDYVASDRRHYSELQGAFAGRDSQNDSSRRYLESVSLNSRHQVELHDRMDQASLRQQQLLKAQQLQQPGTNIRQDECYTPMSLPTHSQEISSYGARMDADPRGLSGFGAAYGGQVAASILGGAPRRNVDDLMYVQGSSNAAYGVGLPPGRDYAAGKGILSTPHESNYQSSVLARSHPVLGVSMVDERNDDRHTYRRELEIREEERRRELLWEREKEREREEREREREREREHERERERERERKRERERERERLQEHREKERERERRRALEARRERTPPRPIRDHRGSSLIKDKKAVRRTAPHREAVHRHHSPVKEKKREYICKVYPFCLVDAERDHLSVSKRYPRLVIATDFSKAIVNWPRETLNLSLHTPVSFEHDFLDVEDKSEEKGPVSLQESPKSKGVKTVWNTKVILMSGISVEALQELCFGKDTDEKPVHVNNILKFAVMKKDRSFSAIGGPSHVSSDGDLQVDDFSLIQTAIRHVKHLTQLDLHSCHHWNRFLEIHYDRVGKDGFFSHKEVTVFYVPNLSECLPSLDQWRGQWLTYKEEKTEREQVSKEKKPAEMKESGPGEKTQSKTVNNNSAGTLKSEDNLVKEEMADVKGNDQSKVDVGEPNKIPSEQNEKTLALADAGRKDDVAGGPSKISENLVTVGGYVDLSAEIKKTTKKKVVKKVVKGKVVSKKAIMVEAGSSIKHEENMDIEDGITEDKHGNADKEDTISADRQRPATVTMTIVTKGTPGKSPLTEDKANSSEALTGVKTKNEPTVMDGTEVVKNEHDGGSVAQDVEVKTTGKRKIIRRVIKRKIYTPKVKDAIANKNTEDTKGDVKSDLENKETVEFNISENKTTEESSTTNKKDHLNEKTVTDEKTKRETKSVDSDAISEKRSENVNGAENVKDKSSKKSGQDGKERKKDEKVKSKDGNQKSNKEKEKGGSKEPPKHAGLILKSHRSKGSKDRSVSLSLDGLLDYSDKDIEESSYELSLFAEAFNEMLQFEMGCRLLSFLEKLNKKYTLKRNSRKRQRDEKPEKVSEKEKSPIKRPKSNDSPVVKEDTSNKDKGEAANIVTESIKSGKEDVSDKMDSENKDVDGSSGGRDETKTEEKAADEEMIDEDEDPEEIIEEEEEEEEEEADDDFRSDEVQKDDKADVKAEAESEVDVKMDVDSVVMNESNTDKIGNDKAANANEAADKNTKPANANEAVADDNKQNADQTDTVKDKDSVKTVKEASTGDGVVDKELLEAFRYFDKNRTGYIKVQDLRCILHNMGKFMTNRHVKELAQSALLESNSARDDRVFYKKLVKMAIGDI